MNDPVVAFTLVLLTLAALLAAPWWGRRVILSSQPSNVTLFVNETTDWTISFLEKKRFTLSPTPIHGILKLELPGDGMTVGGLPSGVDAAAPTLTLPTDGELSLTVTGEEVGGPYLCTVQAIDGGGNPLAEARNLSVIVIEGLPASEEKH